MVTVTDKRVKQAVYLFALRVEKEYGQHFPIRTAGDAFFDRLAVVEERLIAALEKRPITKAEINSLADRAFKALRATMLKTAETVKQPRFIEQINLGTGESKMIPDYNELP